MNINNSGKIPDMIKKLTAAAVLVSTLLTSGCAGNDSGVPDTSPVDTVHSSAQDNISSEAASSDGEASSEAVSSAAPSAVIASSSEETLSKPDPVSEPESVPDPVSEPDPEPVSVPDPEPVSEPDPEPVSEPDPEPVSVPDPEPVSVPDPEPVSEPDPEPVSEPDPEPVSVPESKPASVTESKPVSVPASKPDPDPPAPVVVPTVDMPSSPGKNCEKSKSGTVDYSNVKKGYVSAKYTGSSSRVKVIIEHGEDKYTYDLDASGKTEYFPLNCGDGNYKVTVYENTHDTKFAEVVSASFKANLQSAVSPYLYPNQYCDYNGNSNCVYKAAELCAGKSGTIDKIAAIFIWVSDNISYDYALADSVSAGYLPDPDRTMSLKKGICFDYAALMNAMLRSQSIPSRMVVGYMSPDIYHAWNEVYTEETGWITPELMLKKAGYNLTDSTTYSASSNKQKAAEFIENSSNYQSMYYY